MTHDGYAAPSRAPLRLLQRVPQRRDRLVPGAAGLRFAPRHVAHALRLRATRSRQKRPIWVLPISAASPLPTARLSVNRRPERCNDDGRRSYGVSGRCRNTDRASAHTLTVRLDSGTARAERIARGTGGMVRNQDAEHLRGTPYIPGTSIGKPAADRPVVRAVAEAVDEAGRNGLGFAGQTVPSGGSDPSNRYRTT